MLLVNHQPALSLDQDHVHDDQSDMGVCIAHVQCKGEGVWTFVKRGGVVRNEE